MTSECVSKPGRMLNGGRNPGWGTFNIRTFNPRDRRIYARRLQRVLGQLVARHPIDGVAVGGRDGVRHLREGTRLRNLRSSVVHFSEEA